MFLNDGNVWVSSENCDFLFIQIGDVDNVDSGEFVVGWFGCLVIEIAFLGLLLFRVRVVAVVSGGFGIQVWCGVVSGWLVSR